MNRKKKATDVGADFRAIAKASGTTVEHPARLSLWNAWYQPVNLASMLHGSTAFLICGGPSLVDNDLSLLDRRGITTMGVNNSWLVYRPKMWVCVDNPQRFAFNGWHDPGVMKFAPSCHMKGKLRRGDAHGNRDAGLTVRDCPNVFCFQRSNLFNPDKWLDETEAGWGNGAKRTDTLGITGQRSVMLVAMKILFHMGAREVYCVGADFGMSQRRKYAFAEVRTKAAVRHNNKLYKALDQRFACLRPQFEERNFHVYNCTKDSGLTAFDFVDFEEAIERTTSRCMTPVDPSGWYCKNPEQNNNA